MNDARNQMDRAQSMSELPGGKKTRPATVMVADLRGLAHTFIVQTVKTEGEGWAISLQQADINGTTQLVLPDKVAQAIYRQRAALSDRSTPASRAKRTAKREREKAKAQKAARRAARAKANGEKGGG